MSEDLGKSRWLKSCPNCSKAAGHLVWRPYPEGFGRSDKRSRSGAQSWCLECRKDK